MNEIDIKRLEYIDIAKGIAIIAVVLGHCFPVNLYPDHSAVSYHIATWIYDFVYMWHMPLFFFLSGYLFFNSWNSHKFGTLKKRTFRLLIPYLTFSLIYIPLRIIFPGMANSQYNDYWKIVIGVSPNGGLWFLYVLFIFMFISIAFIRNKKMLCVFLCVFAITNVVVNSGLQIRYSILKYCCAFFVFFVLGILRNYEISEKYEKLIEGYIGIKIVIFIILFFLQEFYSIKSFSIFSSIIGINLVIFISKSIHNCWLKEAGEKSMEIYLLHGPILVVLRTVLSRFGIQNICVSIIMFVCGLVISFLFGKYVLHLNRIFEFIFLGISFRGRKE